MTFMHWYWDELLQESKRLHQIDKVCCYFFQSSSQSVVKTNLLTISSMWKILVLPHCYSGITETTVHLILFASNMSKKFFKLYIYIYKTSKIVFYNKQCAKSMFFIYLIQIDSIVITIQVSYNFWRWYL